ncbi:MAG: hypothetical protein IPL88_09855 [Rhizobiales bacterium]|nr:hypothetical protein [Hyphomicrobiales bacterium]
MRSRPPKPPSDPNRRPTVERDHSVLDEGAEAFVVNLATAALAIGFLVYAWRTGMGWSEAAGRIAGAAIAYFASQRLTVLFGDWKAWRLRGAATLWLPTHLQLTVSVVSFVLARQLPQMQTHGVDMDRRIFGLPGVIVFAIAVQALMSYFGPDLQPVFKQAFGVDLFGTFSVSAR